MRASNMFDMAVQTNKTSPIKHENKRNVLSCLIECLMTLKFFQTRSNITKQGGQTVKCLVTKQCLVVFGRQTLPVWTGLNTSVNSRCSFQPFQAVKSWVLLASSFWRRAISNFIISPERAFEYPRGKPQNIWHLCGFGLACT